MTLAHGGQVTGVDLLPVVVLVATAGGYLALVGRHRGRGRRWSRWRTASFLTGVALLTLAVLVPAGDFHWHMAQHLLVGMYAPLALVLAAPVTLLLASLRPDRARRLTRLLRGGPARVLAHPATALVLNVGGLVALYFTPLYQATTTNSTLHHLVHAHFLAAGFLFAWVIAGPDPGPHRPGVPARLVVLGVAIAAHAVLAQLIYAGALVDVPVPEQERRAAGDLMYYGGDTAELLLALALLATWRPSGRHRAGPRPALALESTPRKRSAAFHVYAGAPVDQRYIRK